MNATEPQRHHLYERAKSGWDEDAAETLMKLLPTVGWADVATKHDIARLEQRMDRFEQRMDRFDQRFDKLEARIDTMQARFVTWLLTSQATIVAVMVALATLTD